MPVDKSRIDKLNSDAINRAIGAINNLFDPVSNDWGTGYPEVDADLKSGRDCLLLARSKLTTLMEGTKNAEG